MRVLLALTLAFAAPLALATSPPGPVRYSHAAGSTLGFASSYDGETFDGRFAQFTTDIAFDPRTRQMHIGLVTLNRAPWYRSLRLWIMGFIAFEALQLIGKGKALEIVSALLVIG